MNRSILPFKLKQITKFSTLFLKNGNTLLSKNLYFPLQFFLLCLTGFTGGKRWKLWPQRDDLLLSRLPLSLRVVITNSNSYSERRTNNFTLKYLSCTVTVQEMERKWMCENIGGHSYADITELWIKKSFMPPFRLNL